MGASSGRECDPASRQRLRHRADRVTIDLDPTDDPTIHGAQQLSFFNGDPPPG